MFSRFSMLSSVSKGFTPLSSKIMTLILLGSIGTINPAFSQEKPTVSVPDFKNVASVPWWTAQVSSQLADALSNELSSTGGITIVERQNIDDVLSEQELAELGIVKESSKSAKSGEMTGAQYVVLGRVNSYEENVEENSDGKSSSFMGFGGGKSVQESKAYISIDLRVVDTTTGEVIGSNTVEGTAKDTKEVNRKKGSLGPLAGIAGRATGASGVGGAVLDAAGTYEFSEESVRSAKTPVAKAIRAALISASDYVDCILVRKDTCMEEFSNRDSQRRNRTREVLELQ